MIAIHDKAEERKDLPLPHIVFRCLNCSARMGNGRLRRDRLRFHVAGRERGEGVLTESGTIFAKGIERV